MASLKKSFMVTKKVMSEPFNVFSRQIELNIYKETLETEDKKCTHLPFLNGQLACLVFKLATYVQVKIHCLHFSNQIMSSADLPLQLINLSTL